MSGIDSAAVARLARYLRDVLEELDREIDAGGSAIDIADRIGICAACARELGSALDLDGQPDYLPPTPPETGPH